MKSRLLLIATAAFGVLRFTQIASAHPGHGATSGFSAGVQHPFSGIDHILAMIAVGLCAAQIGGRALWLLPATFLAFMIAGGMFAMRGTHVPMIEQGIAASVLLLGLIVASGSRLAFPLTTGLVALFAMFHGYAHGAEIQSGAAPSTYAIGFLIAAATLHAIGLGAGLALKRNGLQTLARISGGAIAVCGVLLFWM